MAESRRGSESCSDAGRHDTIIYYMAIEMEPFSKAIYYGNSGNGEEAGK